MRARIQPRVKKGERELVATSAFSQVVVNQNWSQSGCIGHLTVQIRQENTRVVVEREITRERERERERRVTQP